MTLLGLLGASALALDPVSVVRAGVNSWTPTVYPTNMNTTAMALSPAFPCDRTVFLATDGFGIFRTTEGDQPDPTWYPVNNGLGDLSVTSMSVSPNYSRCDRLNTGDQTVFVGTRTGLLYRSVDGGATWVVTGSGLPNRTNPANYAIAAVALSPNYASDRTIMAAIQSTAAGGPDAVYRSTDGGSVWLPFDAGLTDRSVQAFAMSANFANDATLFLGTRFSGVYRIAGRISDASNSSGVAGAAQPIASPDEPPAAAAPGRIQDIQYPYPSLRMVVTASGALDGQVAYSVPGPVVVTYVVINNGNEPITNLQVIDGGKHDFCGDNPDTTDVNEANDDTLVGSIVSLNPGEQRTLTATFLIRPSDPNETGENGAFKRQRRAGCVVGTSLSAGPVNSQDDVIVQLVQWTSITKSNSEMSDLWIWAFAVSPFFANDQTVYAGSAYGGLFKSNTAGSAGTTWKRVNPGLEPEWVSIRSIVMSPRYPIDRTVYVGAERGVYKGVEQSDGTVAWTQLNRGLQRSVDVRAMSISPNHGADGAVFAATWDGDVYRLYNGTDQPAWVAQRRVLNGLWAWAVDLTKDGVLLAGTWSGGPTWPGILGRNVLPAGTGWQFPTLPAAAGGEATTFAISKPTASGYTIFAGTWDRGLFRSQDAGATWGAVPLPTAAPVRSIAIAPTYPADATVYVATWGAGIFRSFDGGVTWAQLNAGLSDPRIRSVVMSPNYVNDGLVLAGSDSEGVLRWLPAENRWVSSSNGLPMGRVMAMAFSPNFANDGTVVAGTWGGGVAISRDQGGSWGAPNNGLGNGYVRSVAVSPNYAGDNAIYTGTHSGAYKSSDGGNSWGMLGTPGDDLSGIDVTGLVITDGAPRTIFASTGGRGVWQYTEAPGLTSAGGALERIAHWFTSTIR